MNANNQQPKSANFNFLAKRYPDLERIGALCERCFSDDPIITLMTLRQFGELLAQMVAARSGLLTNPREPQADLLRRLRVDASYPTSVLDLFHQIRMDGNAATHHREGNHAKALACLKMARQLGIWFYRTFDDRNFKSGPFQPPRPPSDATADLAAELGRLKAERDAALTEAQRARTITGIDDGTDIYFVSEDKDYRSQLSSTTFNEFLKTEWEDRKTSEIFFYTRISDFFKANFPNIKIASDIERDLAIEELSDSGSFLATHLAMGRLSKHSEFTPLQIEELVRIAISNNQVGWIIGDPDVHDCYKGLLKHKDNLQPDIAAQLDELVKKGLPEEDDIPF